ncbi:RDD family protein [Nocardiopsis potens]|uniref:RDD family protein n=1 Tax=Nocardiopsis potens TaxID=1246458 RepID=UPI0003495EDA|nr:RDD family protein [Nocardiopsis potens]
MAGEWAVLGRRAAARVIDLVLATGINMLVSTGLVALVGPPDTGVPAMAAASVAAFAVYAGYEAAMTAVYGATPGKLWLRVRLVPAGSGGPSARPGTGAVLLRSAVLFGSVLLAYVPVLNVVALMAALYALVSSLADRPRHRGLQDRIARTAVEPAGPGG